MTSSTLTPPGPANLVVDAVLGQHGNANGLNEIDATSSSSSDEQDRGARMGDVTKRNGENGEGKGRMGLKGKDVGEDGSEDDVAPLPTTKTTITTIVHPAEVDGVPSLPSQLSTVSYTHSNTHKLTSSISPSDGSLTLKPIAPTSSRSSHSMTQRTGSSRPISFQPRTSAFDRNNSESAVNSFRGFFTLFWIIIFVGALRVGIKHYSEHGTLFRWTFAKFISQDGLALATSDAAMLASTFACVPFAKALKNGWIRYRGVGMIVQHTYQVIFLGAAVRWTFHKEWPWVQSGFLVLHTLTMLMKIHSYCAYNGELSEKRRELDIKRAELDRVIQEKGGEEACQQEAKRVWLKEIKEGVLVNDTPSNELVASATSSGSWDVKASDYAPTGMRQRVARRKSSTSIVGITRPNSMSNKGKPVPLVGIEALTWHSHDQLRELAIDVMDLDELLVSTGVKKVRWPENTTYFNFVDYLLVPTLVYHLEYPRTNKIRPLYLVEKVGATFGTFMVLLLIVEHVIIPAYPKDTDPFYISLLDLAIPFMVNYLLIFFIIFECILNGFAELTSFADRGFYSDWWNSQSFDEFSRKWNIPVHTFLLRHVYASTISTYHVSKFQAAFVTFLLSACVHELVMAVVMKKLRLYLFLMQMCQLPLIVAGRLPILRRYPALGNLFFWIGLLSGFPLLAVCYIRY
ncbi:BQ2448_2712 [Microbotryum intermedium]|uniref:BQ2448_2712 protein n=1 Tax=Microbotryum intermedium TaxID=269621 RepID=A0A238FGV7_9BASI|nr:BQ2448_2712 [Microbotryum intermedium]